MSNTWIVVSEKGEAAALASFLKLEKADVSALAVGDEALASEAAFVANEVTWIDTAGAPADNFAAAGADVLAAAGAVAVIGASTAGARAVIGRLSAKSGGSVVSNVIAVGVEGDAVRAERSVLNDRRVEELSLPTPAGLLVSPFSLQLQAPSPCEAGTIVKADAEPNGNATYAAVDEVEASPLLAAERIVSVGNGIANEESLAKAQHLADAIGAEIGCSMPVANDLQLLPHERYIGTSGKKVAPKLYLALGISGTTQHLAGIRNAKTIVAVNKDPKALFFGNADYGIVGDLNELIPELERALA